MGDAESVGCPYLAHPDGTRRVIPDLVRQASERGTRFELSAGGKVHLRGKVLVLGPPTDHQEALRAVLAWAQPQTGSTRIRCPDHPELVVDAPG